MEFATEAKGVAGVVLNADTTVQNSSPWTLQVMYQLPVAPVQQEGECILL